MKTRLRMAAATVILGLVLSGCAENPADKVPSAQVKTPSATATMAPTGTPAAAESPAAAVEGTVYTFADGTEIGFIGSKVTGSHEGGFKGVTGTVTVPEGGLEQAVVELTVDMKTMYADNEKLLGHLKDEDFFAVDKFPQSTFKSSSLAKDGENFKVTGDLTMHGVTKTISFPAKISMEESGVKTSAEFSIHRKDFGIVYAGKPDDLIRDEVVIKYDISAGKKG